MNYDEISKHAESLSYRDKFRLAQLLIQWARKEEEEAKPDQRQVNNPAAAPEAELVNYVAERLRKLKAGKKDTVLNSIGAMFQFQGGIADADKEKMFAALVKSKQITVSETGRISYPT